MTSWIELRGLVPGSNVIVAVGTPMVPLVLTASSGAPLRVTGPFPCEVTIRVRKPGWVPFEECAVVEPRSVFHVKQRPKTTQKVDGPGSSESSGTAETLEREPLFSRLLSSTGEDWV